MLVLARNVGQVLIIGNDIEVIVLGVQGGQVRIGVKAPRTVPVHREEIYEAMEAQGDIPSLAK